MKHTWSLVFLEKFHKFFLPVPMCCSREDMYPRRMVVVGRRGVWRSFIKLSIFVAASPLFFVINFGFGVVRFVVS